MFFAIFIAAIAVPFLAWAIWLTWCYCIARAHPKRAADIIGAAGVSFPFHRRRSPRT